MIGNSKSIYLRPLIELIVFETEAVLINESIKGGDEPDDPWDE